MAAACLALQLLQQPLDGVQGDQRAALHVKGALNGIFQLPHIARPTPVEKQVLGHLA